MNEPTQLTEKFSSQIKWENDIQKYKEFTDNEDKLLTEIQGKTESNSIGFQFNINPKINSDLLAYGAKHKTTVIIFEYFYKTDSDLIILLLTKNPSMELGKFNRHIITFPLDIATGNDEDLLLNILASIKDDSELNVLVDYEDHIVFKLNDDEMLMFFFDPNVLDEKFMEALLSSCIQESKAELFLLADYGSSLIGICNSNNPVIKNITEAMN